MSATPTRVDWEAPLAGPEPTLGSPLDDGNRVLESIARHEGLRALLAFSGLHEQIRNRRPTAGSASDWELFQTERFVVGEVLQLICNRTQAITQADGVALALAEGSEMVCRASAGPLPIPHGARLGAESEFLRECLESGRILRCDDSRTDARVEMDFSQQMGARATVLVPLRGRSERLGVLQAFSTTPWAFTDQDVRCFDLFAELVLAALRPEDQDRRFHWLSGVAGEVLQAKPAAAAPAAAVTPATGLQQTDKIEIEPAAFEPKQFEPTQIEPKDEPALPAHDELLLAPSVPLDRNLDRKEDKNEGAYPLSANRSGTSLTSHPGLNVVMGLVAVAALFSAGVWWGMQVHGKTPAAKNAETKIAATTIAAPKPVSSPPAPDVLSPAVSDNLMDPAQGVYREAALTPIPESKLAALPKITGVRHWSSSMGSTVVIDMEDQAPYEVHRLMSPERIYFDLHDTALAAELDGKIMDVGDVSLTRVRVAQPVAGVTRVVLDTRDGSNFSVSMESNPYRLVVELRDSPKSVATNRPALIAPPATKPVPTAALAATTSAQPLPAQLLPAKTGKFRIVLDAGHGGWDLGTVGRQGLLEKDLVLDVAQRLGKLLRDRLGSEVMLTRSGDEYLPLDQRADFANQAQADLFVSVHANYSSSATARGVETYYTNLFSAPGSREVEKHAEGAAAQPAPVSLSAEGLREKTEESRRLAESVQRSLYAALAAKSPDIRDRGIKDSAFTVLTGTTMPAILTEISFVSSPADERNLQSENYRQQIAEALCKGIERYQESFPRAKVAQLQSVAARR